MRIRFCLIPLAALFCSAVSANAMSTTLQSTAEPEITNLAPVAVSRALRGPALWKVTKEDRKSVV